MLDSIRARLRRATERRKRTDSLEGFQGLVEAIQEPIYTRDELSFIKHEPILTRPQTVDLGSLRHLEGGECSQALQQRQVLKEVERPKTSQTGGARSRLEKRRNGGEAEVLNLEGRRGGAAGRSAVQWEIAVEESPLHISTMPLREALVSPRNRSSSSKPSDPKTDKHRKDTCQKSEDLVGDRRAKTSHGSRITSLEGGDVARSTKKRVQSARAGAKTPPEGQENQGVDPEGKSTPSPYDIRTESRPSSSQGAGKSPRKRPGSFKRSSVLAPTLGTPNGLDGSTEKFEVRGRSKAESNGKEGRIPQGGVLKEANEGGVGRSSGNGWGGAVGNNPPGMEWRKKTPRLAKNMPASSPPQDPPPQVRGRRKSDGDQIAPKRKSVTNIGRRKENVDTPAASAGGEGVVSEPVAPPLTAFVSSGGAANGILDKPVEPPPEENSEPVLGLRMTSATDARNTGPAKRFTVFQPDSASGSPSKIQSALTPDVTSLADSSVLLNAAANQPESVLPKSGSVLLVGSGTTEYDQKAVRASAALVTRGSNRPSTPSPFAIVSKKQDDVTRSSKAVARSLFGPSGEEGTERPERYLSDSADDGLIPGGETTVPEQSHKKGGSDSSEDTSQANPPKRVGVAERDALVVGREAVIPSANAKMTSASAKVTLSRANVTLPGADVTSPDARVTSSLGRDKRAGEPLGRNTSDVMVTGSDALSLGQQAERRLMAEGAALMEWLGVEKDALLQDLLGLAPLLVTLAQPSATNSPRTLMKRSPRGSPKGPPRSPSSSPRLVRRGSPISRVSPLWIPP